MGHRFQETTGRLVVFMQRLGIKAASAEQKIHELSGGNQQKVLGAMAVQEYETSSPR